MRNSLVRLSRRFQSTTVTTTAANVSSSLDLDFVLNLLDHSSSSNSNNSSSNISSSTTWVPRMKFKIIEEAARNEESFKVIKDEFLCIEKRNDFSNLFGNFEFNEPDFSASTTTTISTLNRLQSLADSLPTQIYDRNGNLIPLNTSHPPMNFFDMNTTNLNATNHQAATLPIFHRENVDWSKISLTSILKKIVPEEVFKTVAEPILENNEKAEDTACSGSACTTKAPSTKCSKAQLAKSTTSLTSTVAEFTQLELKLLDRDQLKVLAKYLDIPCDQTDYRIELAILATHKPRSKVIERNNFMKNVVSKDKISWTEENETLLMKLYEELRVEKNIVDQRLHSIVSHSTSVPNVPSLKRGNGASDRGLWAVLGNRMRLASKFHVSVTECRNKLIILKRLKA